MMGGSVFPVACDQLPTLIDLCRALAVASRRDSATGACGTGLHTLFPAPLRFSLPFQLLPYFTGGASDGISWYDGRVWYFRRYS